MHLALLGLCPESLDLAHAAGSRGHRVTWFLSEDERRCAAGWLETLGGSTEPCDQWESLLDAPHIEGVVLAEAVAENIEARSEQWRRLAQAGGRMIVIHPVVPALLVYLEVDMLARESGAVLVPYWPAAYSPSAGKLQAHAAGADYGLAETSIEQVNFHRHVHDRSPANVTRWLARDAALLDLFAGPFGEIAAMGPDTTDAAYAALAVHLHGPRGIPVRWEVARAQGDREQGLLVAAGPDTDLTLDFPEPTTSAIPPPEPSAEALAGIEAFAELIHSTSPRLESWQRCVRAMELSDSVEISLRRGRRIEVHYRQMTEETSYKGLMSAVGCGLLVLALVILVFAGMLHAVFGWPLMRFWYIPVLVLFVAFLVLQLFARLAVRPPRNVSPDPSSSQAGRTG